MTNDKKLSKLQTYHPAPGITVTVTPLGVLVEHRSDAPEFSVSVTTTGMIVSQRGGDKSMSLVLAKGARL